MQIPVKNDQSEGLPSIKLYKTNPSLHASPVFLALTCNGIRNGQFKKKRKKKRNICPNEVI